MPLGTGYHATSYSTSEETTTYFDKFKRDYNKEEVVGSVGSLFVPAANCYLNCTAFYLKTGDAEYFRYHDVYSRGFVQKPFLNGPRLTLKDVLGNEHYSMVWNGKTVKVLPNEIERLGNVQSDQLVFMNNFEYHNQL